MHHCRADHPPAGPREGRRTWRPRSRRPGGRRRDIGRPCHGAFLMPVGTT
jgi:hypothetical protein